MNDTTQLSKSSELAFSLPQISQGPANSTTRDATQVCGQCQSPVSVTRAVKDATLPPLEINYRNISGQLIRHGSTVQLACQPGSYLVFEKQAYGLEQIHFHLPGEHRINGRFYPMCLHLVHRDSQSRLAVVELALEYGEENAFLVCFWERLQDRPSAPFIFNPAGLIGNDPAYFTYQGSLTTAPFTEGVTWLVLKDPAQASLAQVSQYLELFGTNARSLQPLNQRIIKEYQAILSSM
jgi:carbonic anhydrase